QCLQDEDVRKFILGNLPEVANVQGGGTLLKDCLSFHKQDDALRQQLVNEYKNGDDKVRKLLLAAGFYNYLSSEDVLQVLDFIIKPLDQVKFSQPDAILEFLDKLYSDKSSVFANSPSVKKVEQFASTLMRDEKF